MTRHAMPAAGLTAAALILLTACGGGGSSDNSDKISPTVNPSTTAAASPSVTPSGSATTGLQRPVITLQTDTKMLFEDQHTGDPVKDAVLADEARGLNAVYAAILQGKARTPALEFYLGGRALRASVDYVQGWLDKGNTWTGTVRYFDRKVTLRSDGSAVVIYCSDETKAFLKNRKTGKVEYDAPSTNSYVQYNERLVKYQNVWQTVNVLENRGAQACQP